MIQDLDPNKAHGHGMISIRMPKICGESISKPLDQFPNEWDKANVAPVYKKEIRKCQKITDMFHYFHYMEKYLNV